MSGVTQLLCTGDCAIAVMLAYPRRRSASEDGHADGRFAPTVLSLQSVSAPRAGSACRAANGVVFAIRGQTLGALPQANTSASTPFVPALRAPKSSQDRERASDAAERVSPPRPFTGRGPRATSRLPRKKPPKLPHKGRKGDQRGSSSWFSGRGAGEQALPVGARGSEPTTAAGTIGHERRPQAAAQRLDAAHERLEPGLVRRAGEHRPVQREELVARLEQASRARNRTRRRRRRPGRRRSGTAEVVGRLAVRLAPELGDGRRDRRAALPR